MKRINISDSTCQIVIISFLLFSAISASCHNEWLDVKRNKRVVIPSTLEDLQALLDYTKTMNVESTPALGEISADNYYVTDEKWQSLSSPEQKNGYIWAKDIFVGDSGDPEWNLPYRQVFTSNIVLEGLIKIAPQTNPGALENLKGSALFYRAHAFYQLAQLYCKPFSETAETDLGIPLRLESDINLQSQRATVKDTYEQILRDLHESIDLLPVKPLFKTRPSRPAAYALLARTYLQMENYDLSLLYADSCLNAYSKLVDYNLVDTGKNFTFNQFNDEVIFHCTMGYTSILSSSRMNVDSLLYDSYAENDLRRLTFFDNDDGKVTFKGSYDGSILFFSGLATDEMLLTRAECYVRKGEVQKGMDDLNKLLRKRFVKETFIPLTATDQKEALEMLFEERRKELVYRGIRYSDLRRINKDERFAVPLKRIINGRVYNLLPNEARYVLPIPDDVIRLSGMPQNAR